MAKAKKKRGLYPRQSSIMLSFDEMDISGTAYSKVAKKVRKKSGASDKAKKNVTSVPTSLHKSYFVPLALCIKTKNPYNEPAEQLLSAFTDLLCTELANYKTDTQNLIYSYAEFVSHAMLLTHLTSPPPMTQYSVMIGSREVLYTEGLIGELPYESDISVAQVFSLLDNDCIMSMWAAMLLDIRVILYTANINGFFFILKALDQLMFPFRWNHTKGIIPSRHLLTQPPPYCYGKFDRLSLI